MYATNSRVFAHKLKILKRQSPAHNANEHLSVSILKIGLKTREMASKNANLTYFLPNL